MAALVTKLIVGSSQTSAPWFGVFIINRMKTLLEQWPLHSIN